MVPTMLLCFVFTLAPVLMYYFGFLNLAKIWIDSLSIKDIENRKHFLQCVRSFKNSRRLAKRILKKIRKLDPESLRDEIAKRDLERELSKFSWAIEPDAYQEIFASHLSSDKEALRLSNDRLWAERAAKGVLLEEKKQIASQNLARLVVKEGEFLFSTLTFKETVEDDKHDIYRPSHAIERSFYRYQGKFYLICLKTELNVPKGEVAIVDSLFDVKKCRERWNWPRQSNCGQILNVSFVTDSKSQFSDDEIARLLEITSWAA